MTCPACGHDNRATAKFCEECAAPLVSARGRGASPGTEVRATVLRAPLAYTPRHLAERILTARAALEGERKQVTVLFADVQGSMDISEQLDPEDWHRLMDQFFAILAEGVHRFEGTVNQYTGDGVMALFGAPLAHEDHAQRACHAALHLREALRRFGDRVRAEHGLAFPVRIGLNSGEVVVGRIGDDLRMDYTAQGHTVGLAARVQQLAEPGKPLLTAHTAKLVAGYFTLRDLGPARIKGVSDAVQVAELDGVGPLRTRFDAARLRGLSRFIGRARELAVLEEALAEATSGHGVVVGVVAEPGVGKSRLVYEFASRCRARGLRVAEAHGLAHATAVPLLPWLELMRRIFGVAEVDGAEVARDRIAGRTLRLDPDLVEMLPLVYELLGVPDPEHPAPPMDPEARQRQLATFSERLIDARGRRGELAVYVMEDLHWFDAASEVFLRATLDAIGRTRSLGVLNFRPEYARDWMSVPWYRALRLPPLGEADADALLRDLLGDDPALAGLATLIRERTGGNPFFIEEAVQSLVEDGALAAAGGERRRYTLRRPVTDIRLPATVQSLLTARIDRLPDDAKAVLQTAAVIGRRFARPVLESVLATDADPPALHAALHELERAELIVAAADDDGRSGTAELIFKHPLTHEVAYRTQLGDRRRRTHAAVARVLEAVHAPRLDEHAALLAHHWEAAGERLQAARWHRRAAEWIGLRDRREAARHWKTVCALLEGLPLDAESAQLGTQARFRRLLDGVHLGQPDDDGSLDAEVAELGTLARFRRLLNAVYLGQPEDEQRALFTEGRALALAHGGPLQVMLMSISYGTARVFAGAVREGVAELREALRIAEATGDRTMRFIARASLVNPLHFHGRLREALACSDEALALSGDDPRLGVDAVGFSPYAVVVLVRSVILARAGDLGASARELARAADIVRAVGDAEAIGTTHVFAVLWAQLSGDDARVLDEARAAVAVAERGGSPFFLAGAYATLGYAMGVSGDWDAAASALEHALNIVAERRTGRQIEPSWLGYLSDVRLAQGRAADALALADQALALARERDTQVWILEACLARARALCAGAGAEAAAAIAASLDEAAALIDSTGATTMRGFVARERAALAALQGNTAARLHHLRAAHAAFTAAGASGQAARVAALLEA